MSEKYQGSAFTGSVGLICFLTILFLWLKIIGVVDWSLALVLSPIWIGLIAYVLIVVGVFLFAPENEES